jgi:1-acyl-sn-glycerol-3-phosphate acyltransferase
MVGLRVLCRRNRGESAQFHGQNTLFKWPMTNFMLDMGGIPIDRSKRQLRRADR